MAKAAGLLTALDAVSDVFLRQAARAWKRLGVEGTWEAATTSASVLEKAYFCVDRHHAQSVLEIGTPFLGRVSAGQPTSTR